MIFINNNIKKVLDNFKCDNTCVIADFDNTITSGNSLTSWNVFTIADSLSDKYKKESNDLYFKYKPIENDLTLEYNDKFNLMKEWWSLHTTLFVKYKLNKNVIVDNVKHLELRDGFKDFVFELYNKNIPLIIISAGISNVIEEFLKYNNCYYDNIYIVSNTIYFLNDIAVGMNDNIIHSMNKDKIKYDGYIRDVIKNRNNVILFGDSIDDIKMTNSKSVLKVGFLEHGLDNLEYFNNNFDIVCTDNISYREVIKEINNLIE